MNSPADFAEWAASPSRTVEEAYFIERVVTLGVEAWNHKRHGFQHRNWEAQRELARARRLNPAHRIKLPDESIQRCAEMLPEIQRMDLDCYEDRPIRDLSGLRFFPNLKGLSIGWSEVKDISPIGELAHLEELHFTDGVAEDLRPLGRCHAVKFMVLRIKQPWPTLGGWEGLTQVGTFHYHGNLLPLEDVPSLPGVHTAVIEAYPHGTLPPRDCRRLPLMPSLRRLQLGTMHRLDGIERWDTVENLTVEGECADLEPLARLAALTHLELKGNVTRDLSPLARLPQLRHLTVSSDHPQDYSVFAEAPLLHEVTAKGCDINKLELGTLHALLSPWSDEFELPEPRPLGPARFVVGPHKHLPKNPRAKQGNAPDWASNQGMAGSEGQWMQRKIRRRVARALDHPRWGSVSAFYGGHGYITVSSLDAAERLPEIVQVIRECLASSRLPWCACLFVNLDAEWERDDETDPELVEALREQRYQQEAINDHLDYLRRRQEHKEFLERQHRLRLLEQDGRAVNPQDFAAPAALPAKPPVPEEEEDVDVGDVLEKRKKDPPRREPSSHPLAKALAILGAVTEEEFYVCVRDRGAAVHLMGREPDAESSEPDEDD